MSHATPPNPLSVAAAQVIGYTEQRLAQAGFAVGRCRSCRGTGSIQRPTSENEVARDWTGKPLRAGQSTACPHGCHSRLADTEGDQTPGG